MSDYFEHLTRVHAELGISPDILKQASQLYYEIGQDALFSGGMDKFSREFFLTEAALSAWRHIRAAAQKDHIELQVVSAYRSVAYQVGLIRRKLERGITIEEILKINAAPGLSEHHTGRALDLTSTEETEVLTENFENTQAFKWLCQHAHDFGFSLSYPRGNSLGFDYEPWHWCFQAS